MHKKDKKKTQRETHTATSVNKHSNPGNHSEKPEQNFPIKRRDFYIPYPLPAPNDALTRISTRIFVNE